jgi:hypothetical protein
VKKGKLLFILFLAGLAFFALGYFRNYMFLAINDRASALYYHTDSPQLNGLLRMFQYYDYNGLITAKWVLTFIFTVLFSVLSVLTVYAIFRNKQNLYLSIGMNAFVFIISLLFILPGKLFPAFASHGFSISRSLAHLVQSPIITLILLLAIYFNRKTV